jgi:hypothetical protein
LLATSLIPSHEFIPFVNPLTASFTGAIFGSYFREIRNEKSPQPADDWLNDL